MDTMITKTSTVIPSHTMRPRTLAPWATSACISPVSYATGVAAGSHGTDVRDFAALQGAPPRENPR